MGNHEQPAEVIGGVNIVSDAVEAPFVEEAMFNTEEAMTGTQ